MDNGHGKIRDIELQRQILHELGYAVNQQSTILDFGCGDGERVCEFRKLGYNAFGVDIKLAEQSEFLRLIESTGNYRIPFADQTFDFVYSNQVFEHVRNHQTALSEIWRVLKPGGISLHLFPPRHRPIEDHTYVPFAGLFQGRLWLTVWALLGVRNSFQNGLTFTEVAARNHKYLRENTCYLTKRDIRRLIQSRFRNVIFAEEAFIKHSYGRARYLQSFVKVCPFISSLISSFHLRVVFFAKD
jgi:SAM-dependent methyltransferase